MPRNTHCASDFSIKEARRIVNDLFEPSPLIYWLDYSVSIAVGATAFFFVRRLPLLSPLQVLAFVVSCLALYRAALFIHELMHLRDGTFKAFRVFWNLTCGIPFLMPSFLYYKHSAHHQRKHYGTREDGEYLPLALGPIREIVLYFCQPFVIPLLAAIRFLAMTPVAWVWPGFRVWVHRRASSMVMDPRYLRPLPTRGELRYWRIMETACFLYTAGAALSMLLGYTSWLVIVQGYCTAVGILTLNGIRTAGAHRFRYPGHELSFLEQILDSLNYPRHPILSELWAPVGLRFHALHHLFPTMPYHALPKAHERLMRELPANSPYRQTECPGLIYALRDLWVSARSSAQPSTNKVSAAS